MTMQQNVLSIYFIVSTKYNWSRRNHQLTTLWQRHCRFSSAGNIDVCLLLHTHMSGRSFLWRPSLCFLWLYILQFLSLNKLCARALSLCLFRVALKVCSQLLPGYMHTTLSWQCVRVCQICFTNLVLVFLVVEADEPAESSDTERWKSVDRALSSLGLKSSGSGKSSSVSGSSTSVCSQ